MLLLVYCLSLSSPGGTLAIAQTAPDLMELSYRLLMSLSSLRKQSHQVRRNAGATLATTCDSLSPPPLGWTGPTGRCGLFLGLSQLWRERGGQVTTLSLHVLCLSTGEELLPVSSCQSSLAFPEAVLYVC